MARFWLRRGECVFRNARRQPHRPLRTTTIHVRVTWLRQCAKLAGCPPKPPTWRSRQTSNSTSPTRRLPVPFKDGRLSMAEINLLDRLPQVKRDPKARAAAKTAEDRAIAKRFDKDFFDGERRHGYGGYRYDGRWLPVARRFVEHYGLPPDARILDIGAAKGFLLYDFLQVLPGASVRGIDVSAYAKENAHAGMGPLIDLGSAEKLPYPDESFDLVLSINSIHNLP